MLDIKLIRDQPDVVERALAQKGGADLVKQILAADADRRRGCELEAKSHVIHLREGFLETHGDSRRITDLIAASAPALAAVSFTAFAASSIVEFGPSWWVSVK